MATSSYRLTVYIDPKWVAKFREQKFNLCTAFAIQSSHSDEVYNIIASSEEPTPLNTISWVDTYEIAGCKSGFDDGAYVFPNTVPTPIQQGQTFTLKKDWSSTLAETPPSQPPAITYTSETASCALLFKSVLNRQRPIYMSALDNEVAPPGKHVLRPLGKVMIFFAKNGEHQTAFDANAVSTAHFELAYASESRHATNVSYSDLGVFSLVEGVATGDDERHLPVRLLKHLEDESAE